MKVVDYTYRKGYIPPSSLHNIIHTLKGKPTYLHHNLDHQHKLCASHRDNMTDKVGQLVCTSDGELLGGDVFVWPERLILAVTRERENAMVRKMTV